MSAADRRRVETWAAARGREFARAFDAGACEVGRDAARRLGLPEGTQRALHEVAEAWNGSSSPRGLAGDDIAPAARIARAAGDAAFLAQVRGPEFASAGLRARAGSALDPRSSRHCSTGRRIRPPQPPAATRARWCSRSSRARSSDARPPSWRRWPRRSATSPT